MAQANVKIAVDATSAVNKLRQVNQVSNKLSNTQKNLKNRLDKSNRSIDRSGRAAAKASGGVNKLVGAVRNLVIGFAAIKTAQFVFVKTAELETQRKSLEVLTNSLEDTNQIIRELQAFGAVTPFTSSELIETTKRLKAFGFETEQLVDVTKRLADVAGATGADLGGIATAFGQIQAKGRLQGEELLQLQERGVNLQSELTDMYGLTAEEFRKALEGGKFSADAVNIALQNLTDAGGKYANGAIAQSDTLNGRLSTLQDSIETLARTIGEDLGDEIKAIINLGIRGVQSINRFIERISFGGKGVKADLDAANVARRETQEKFNLGRFSRVTGVGVDKEISDFFKERKEFNREANLNILRAAEKDVFTIGGIKYDANMVPIPNQPALEETPLQKQEKKTLDKSDLLNNKQKKETSEYENQLKLITRKNELLTARLEGNELEIEQKHREIDLIEQVGVIEAKSILDAEEKSRKLEEQNRILDRQKEIFTQIGDSIATGISDALVGAIEGTRSLGEAAKSILSDIGSQLMRLGINTLLFSAFGGAGGIFKNLTTFANGGRPPVGRASIVGEKGPELFVPSSAGTIVPNDRIGGGITNNIVVNVDASGSNVEGNEQESRELGLVLSAAIQAQLVQEKRPGGLLA